MHLLSLKHLSYKYFSQLPYQKTFMISTINYMSPHNIVELLSPHLIKLPLASCNIIFSVILDETKLFDYFIKTGILLAPFRFLPQTFLMVFRSMHHFTRFSDCITYMSLEEFQILLPYLIGNIFLVISLQI